MTRSEELVGSLGELRHLLELSEEHSEGLLVGESDLVPLEEPLDDCVVISFALDGRRVAIIGLSGFFQLRPRAHRFLKFTLAESGAALPFRAAALHRGKLAAEEFH